MSDLVRALTESPASIPSSLFGLPEQPAHERVLFATDEQTGLKTILAVHSTAPVSYTHLRAHETRHDLVCRLLLEKNFFNDTATTEIYTLHIVGSVRCV